MARSPDVAPAETSGSTQSPYEHAQSLFETLPVSPAHAGANEKARRLHVCKDGSKVYASDTYGSGSHYIFIVFGPTQGPLSEELRGSEIRSDFDNANNGLITLPELPVMLGEEQIATIPEARTMSTLNEAAQHAVLGWMDSIVENDQYAPLGLTVPGR